MVFVSVGDAVLYVDRAGRGEHLLLLHGALGTHRQFAGVKKQLGGEFDLLMPDQRGIGASTRGRRVASMSVLAEDMIELFKCLEVGHAHVLGYSMGAAIALELALACPEQVDRLVLVSGSAGGASERVTAARRALDGAADVLSGRWLRERCRLTYSPGFLQRHPGVLSEVARQRIGGRSAEVVLSRLEARRLHDTTDRLGLIEAPTLVIAGGGDRLVDPENSVVLAEGIRDARLLVYQDCGHAVLAERADEVVSDVRAFLREGPSSRTRRLLGVDS